MTYHSSWFLLPLRGQHFKLEKLESGWIFLGASFGKWKSWIFGTICSWFHAFMYTSHEMRAFWKKVFKNSFSRLCKKCDFPKIRIFYLVWKFFFENFFSKCSHLKTIWWKLMKPTASSHKYPKFSYAEKKYWGISELYKFEVLASCGPHTNEVICPYPLACPW